MLPERFPGGVVGEEEEVALRDVEGLQAREARFHQPLAQAASARTLGHREMVKIAAPTVVPAKHRADDFALRERDEAEPGLRARYTSIAGCVSDSLSPTPSVAFQRRITAS